MEMSDSEVLASVILTSDEPGEVLGRVLDQAIGVLHADMQSGKITPAEFERTLASMQDIRDDVVSRADAGQALPNGERLCYFTPESIRLLRTAFAAAMVRPEQSGVPAERLRVLNDKFVRAAEARSTLPQPAEARPEGIAFSRWLPAVAAVIWDIVMYSPEGTGTVVVALIAFLPLAYLAAFVTDGRHYGAGQRLAALSVFPFYLFLFVPFVWFLGRLNSQPSPTPTPVLGTPSPRTTTTVVRTHGASVVVVNRAPEERQAQAPPVARAGSLDWLRQRTPRDLERLTSELIGSWGFGVEQRWPMPNGDVELTVSQGAQRALARCCVGKDPVTLSVVQDLQAHMAYQALGRGYLFTTGYVAADAQEWGRSREIEFLDGPTWLARLRDANLDGVV